MGIKDRIIQLIGYKNISVNAFEKAIGASKSYISNTKSISAEVVSNIVRIYSDVSPEWLLTGEGDMLKENVDQIEDNKDPEVIYHYTSTKNLFGIIGSGKFALSDLSGSNDVWERITSKGYRCGSFCAGNRAYIKPRMWDQYGETNNGVCIGFRLSELKKRFNEDTQSFFVKYRSDQKLKILQEEDKVYFKGLDWRDENEYRIISKSQKEISIDRDCIESVYVGLYYSSSYIEDMITSIGLNSKLVGFFESNLGFARVNPFKYFNLGERESTDVQGAEIIRMKPKEDVEEEVGIENAKRFYEELSSKEMASRNNSFIYYNEYVEGSIPFYEDLPVSAGQQNLALIQATEKPSGWIKPAEVLTAIGAFPVIGCSMEPFIHQGDFITVAPVEKWDRVDPDKVYMIITVSDRMIKHLSQDEENDEIIWGISPNYPRVKIYKSEIKAVFRITFHGKLM